MSTTYFYDWKKHREIPGTVTFLEGNGGLPKIEVVTPQSTAEIYLLGATITHFQKVNEKPMLFLSRVSRFEPDQPIRGGIPIVFPWFGPREGQAQHGFARHRHWDLQEISTLPDHSVRLRFQLPDSPDAALLPEHVVQYTVTIGESLGLELSVRNKSEEQPLEFENLLHTYLLVGDIEKAAIVGLKNSRYLDKVEQFASREETKREIRIDGETDRIHIDTESSVEVIDELLQRKIRIEKSGSQSTVVWNPWIKKSQEMPDFGNDEYRQMVCVESGNVANNKMVLPPGEASTLKVKLICNTL